MLIHKVLKFLSFAALICVSFHCNAASEILKNSDGTETKLKVTYQIASDTNAQPTVILAHGSAGVSANHYWWADVINKWGYNTVIVDHYTLRGISRHTGRPVDGARMRDRAKDFADVVVWLEAQPWHKGKISIVGYSQGGGGVMAFVSTELMHEIGVLPSVSLNQVVAAVAFYPSCLFRKPPAQPRIPVLVYLGGKDDLAKPEYCGEMSDPLYTVKMFPDATHSFDENLPFAVTAFTQRYNSSAVDESREIMKKFLDAHMR